MQTISVTLEATPENLAKVVELLGPAKPAKTEKAAAEKPAEKATKKAEPESEHSLTDLKTAVKAAKKDHGEDFCNTVLSQVVELKSSLGRTVSAVDEADYGNVITALEAGPQQADDDLDDDLGGDDDLDDDTPEITAEAVKIALKAYSKEVGRDEARKIMQEIGKAATLSKVDECSKEQLAKMMNAMA